MNNKIKHTDYFIAFAVLIQSLLVILQQVLISVFHIPHETSTDYRMLLTAIPLSIAILITLYKKSKVFLIVYLITLLILSLNIIIFPENEVFLKQNSFRFLLPIVIPSALCLMYISSTEIVKIVLYIISWFTALLALIYVINFFNTNIVLDEYNMSFSYGLLLPMISLYSYKKWYSLLTSIFLFLVVIAIGSRGAAVVFILYILYDLLIISKKIFFQILFLIVMFYLSLGAFAEFFETIGISSRTLDLFFKDDFGYMSGRDNLYKKSIDVFWQNPIKGVGLFGDRVFLSGTYTHNIILEVFLNWGAIFGLFILSIFIIKTALTYLKASRKNKNILIMFLIGVLAPLMVSGSYLIDYNFGVLIGLIFLIGRENKSTSNNNDIIKNITL